jgi:uncharacterized membrane protein
MLQILTVFSVWLHALGTVLLIGHFVLLYLVYIPVLATKDLSILSEISQRSRPWMYLSLLIFMITGAYLTFVDPNYLGLAKFGNLWGILMLIKHVLVLGMIAIGFWFNAVLRVGQMLNSKQGTPSALGRFRWYVNRMAISGVLALFLTAFAQIE